MEKSKNAQLSREIKITLPNELSEAECVELARKFAQKTFVKKNEAEFVELAMQNSQQNQIDI